MRPSPLVADACTLRLLLRERRANTGRVLPNAALPACC
jgi:hypothetical protein